jgi:Xaa-Pro aminopeptidase
MSTRCAARRDSLRPTLQADDVDALLVSHRPNVGYLTGFRGSDAWLLLFPERAIILSDGRYTTQLALDCPDVEAHVRAVNQTMPIAVAEVLTKLGARRVAFEAVAMSVAQLEDLSTKAPTVSWKATRHRAEALREIKDDDEIAAIRQAIAFAEEAFFDVLAAANLGQTEKEVVDALESAMRRWGAAGASFPPIVAVGANAALPHHQPGDEARLGDGDFVLIDWGATGRPYKSDLTRVVPTGNVTPRFEEVYRVVLSAQERALAAIRPGVKAGEVDAQARAALDEAGLGRYFDHGLGHGIGREVHEAPSVRRGSETILRAGMVLTVEPGVYLPGWGGIRIEDDVLVTPDGAEVLTHVPKDPDALRVA